MILCMYISEYFLSLLSHVTWHGFKYSQRDKDNSRDQTMIKYFQEHPAVELLPTFNPPPKHESS